MKRCILETPFAAPKALRDALDAAEAAITNASGFTVIEYATLYTTRAKAQKNVSNAVAKHKRYLKACMRKLLLDGWAPFASHALFTQFLDDNNPAERMIGMNAGIPYWDVCEDVYFGIDLGMSPGMEWAHGQHESAGRTIRDLILGPDWDKWNR